MGKPKSPILFSIGLCAAMAIGFVSAAWGLPVAAGVGVIGRGSLTQLIQAPGGDTARVAVAGQRLIVRAAPRGNSPIVAHIEKGDEVIVVDTQSQWAKIEDYQSGRALGWVYESLLVAPGG